MKKKIALLLGMTLIAATVTAGCSNRKYPEKNENGQTESANTSGETEKNTETEILAEGSLKTGLATINGVGSSADASKDADGTAQADVIMAAVTVDGDGKIVECVIDGAQTVINFGTDGKIKTDLASEFKTKNELGADYGMVAYGGAVAEWNEQAAFADYCEGKTADEVTGMVVTEDGKAADADLAAACTVHIGDFQSVVAKAVENAKDHGAKAGDKLGLGAVTTIGNSKDAAEEDGVAEAYTTVAVTTVNADGIITSAVIDAVQAAVNFDAAGKITTDITAAVQSKNEIGDNYGMKAASSIGKEWNEQAEAYAQYAVGKTVDEVNGTAVTEGVPSDADLAASVTIHIADFNAVLAKAADSAK